MPSYHSAHLFPVHDAQPVDRWEGKDGSVAFVHDLLAADRLPAEYDRCDVLYTDLPWQSGFEVFNDRAGIYDGRTYQQFMAAVSKIVTWANRPTVLVSGKHALRYLPPPAQATPVKMLGTGQPALAIFYNLVTAENWIATGGLTAQLARTYGCIGDFCCGYGNALRAFARQGKPWVASDINPFCIGYIAEYAPIWMGATHG